MARVPIPAGNLVERQGLTDAKFRAADNGGGVLGGLGEGLQKLGSMGSHVAEVEDNKAAEFDATVVRDHQNGYQAFRSDLLDSGENAYLLQKGKNAQLAAPAVKQALQEQRDKIYASFTTQRQRNMWASTGDQMYLSAIKQVGEHAGREENTYERDTALAQIDQSSKSAIATPDPAERQTLIATARNVIMQQGTKDGLPVEKSAVLADAAESKVWEQVITQTALQSPADAQKQFDDVKARVDPARHDEIQQRIDVETRRQQAIAEHAKALQDRATRESIATIKARQASGEVVPDAELSAAEQAAHGLGDESTAVELRATLIRNGVNRETQAWTPMQYDAERARLLALGTKRSPTDDVRLDQIEKVAPQRKSQFDNDPGTWAALNGHPAPTIQLNDPNSLMARTAWQNTVSSATGRPTPFLQPSEVNQLRAQATANPQARMAVIDQIGTIANIDPHRAQAAIRQVLPDDALASRLVVLSPAIRSATANGAEVRKADKTLVDGGGADGAGTAALAKYNKDLAPALMLLRPEDAKATYDVAGNLYANWAHQNGVHDFNPDQFGFFLHSALGAKKDGAGVLHGGIGYWNNTPVWLPSKQSQRQFETVLSRMQWAPDAANAPVYADGKTAMTPADIRKLTPVVRPDGKYEFHNAEGGTAIGRNHQRWVLDIDYLGSKMGVQ